MGEKAHLRDQICSRGQGPGESCDDQNLMSPARHGVLRYRYVRPSVDDVRAELTGQSTYLGTRPSTICS